MSLVSLGDFLDTGEEGAVASKNESWSFVDDLVGIIDFSLGKLFNKQHVTYYFFKIT
jgi:hypothetical protein